MAAQEVLVDDDGTTTPILTVEQATNTGDQLAILLAKARVAARRIDDPDTPGPAVAALMKRHDELMDQIQDIRSETEGDELGQAADSPDEGFDPTSV